MKQYLYEIVELIARLHEKILALNDAYEYHFTDKQLHFLVIGILGMAMVFVIHPLFKWLVKHDHILVVSWLYVFTLILVLTFAIEIGQRITHTGVMEFADIVFGVGGFLLMFAVFACIRMIWKAVLHLIELSKQKKKSASQN